MPRKAFISDLQDATSDTQEGKIYDVKAGDEDGTATFKYRLAEGLPPVTLQALLTGNSTLLHLR